VELISDAVAQWRKGADVVCSVAQSRERQGILSDAFARLLYAFIRHTKYAREVPDVSASPRLIDRKVIDHCGRFAPRNCNFNVWVLQQGFHSACLYYTPAPRRFGRSKWTFRKKVVLAMNTLMDISPVFLTVWLPLGALLILGGLAAGAWALAGLFGCAQTVNSPAILACVLATGGAILMAMGSIGTYLWRIYNDLRHGPEFTVQWTANLSDKK
jgi:dolichol-phosphate mannosyltransferase